MKILHIFGAVVAVHLAVFIIIFAVPGCRSTGKSSSASSTGAPAAGGAVPVMGNEPSPLSASAGEAPASASATVSYQPDAGVRFSPTRPGTPVAAAVRPAPVTDVVPATTYVVVKGDSLSTIAKKHGLTVSELTSANKLTASSILKPGQKLIITAKAAPGAAARAAESAPADSAGPVHVVKGGESLGVIARRYGTTPGVLKRLNNLKSDTVRVGQKLVLPDSGSVLPDVAVSKTPSPAPVSRAGGSVRHTVKSGETLDAISRLYKVSQREIGIANNIADPSKLRPGQELIIPSKNGVKPAAQVPAPAPAESAPAPAAAPVSDPFLPVPAEAEPAIKPAPDVPIIRIEDTPPAATPDSPRAP